MKTSVHVKRIIIESICLLYVVLFVYASVSKLLDFERFQVQLGQSPLLSAFALWIALLTPIIELIIVVLLISSKTRFLGLFLALSIMIMFTTYIFIGLNFSSYVPCSCGGILEKMSWNAHLIFNCFFILIAVLAIRLYLEFNNNSISRKRSRLYYGLTIASVLFSVFSVVVLFWTSEDIMHRKNPFLRRYIKDAVKLVHSEDLKYNSYYFSGFSDAQLYLGNYTDPLGVLAIDTSFKEKKTNRILFEDNELPFRMIIIKVKGPYFYLTDGNVPVIYRGRLAEWEANDEIKNISRFTKVEIIDQTSFVFRNNSGIKGAHLIGLYDSEALPNIRYFPNLLHQQLDGIFDTDGSLLYNAENKKIIYVYFYRNEFIVSDKQGSFKTRHTIDTISKAKIKVAYLKNNTQSKMSAPPFMVNASATTKNNLLFINSKVPGRYENIKNWNVTSVIDVYDYQRNVYLLSFSLFGLEKNKIQSMFLTSEYLYTLSGSELRMYKLGALLKKEMVKKTSNKL
ncbi:MauE/DoxX family redox-associated membrane protein [Flavobacterium sp. CSZ]|uniref:MauE/DoxX family redox-associated membrane protein n=1 Tax=Flavobacterium sp. CSZ TaxID=2783791 RepID=UPI00188C60A7|nr:MauE/DoxX family redox-associated membrane protein [Flavobacterium sp. CSZ]MBF4488224.1 hypothetical protein [Flavobacterium sp. CSZ]